MIDDFIGIPFEDRGFGYDGVDCFGLLVLYYKDILGIALTKHTARYDDIKNVTIEFVKYSQNEWAEIEAPEKNCCVAMARLPKHPKIIQHFGIYLGNGKILHTLKGVGSHITTVNNEKAFIRGYYRWLKQ